MLKARSRRTGCDEGELGDSDVGGGLVGLERLVSVDRPLITGSYHPGKKDNGVSKRSAQFEVGEW